MRQGEHFVGHVEQPQQRRGGQLAQNRYGNAAEQGDQDGGMDGLMDGFVVFLPDGVRNDDVCAQRDADKQIHDQPDDGTVCADRRHGGRFFRTREVAYDGDIRGVEELLEDGGSRHRQREARQFIPDRPVQHIQRAFFVLHRVNFFLFLIPADV